MSSAFDNKSSDIFLTLLVRKTTDFIYAMKSNMYWIPAFDFNSLQGSLVSQKCHS